jgi:ubiquinone/menaquinone biosynthesis C-methylase UbiE
MHIYDAVAPSYGDVFDDIALRRFEWPWLRGCIKKLAPKTILDLGCGNGYLSAALLPLVPCVCAADPSPVMAGLARARLGEAARTVEAGAEALPFDGASFDAVVSFLSFRYMRWDRALGEIFRVLGNRGTLIIIDLFESSFNPLRLPWYAKTWLLTRAQYAARRDYRLKLLALQRNPLWQKMLAAHPKRPLSPALTEIRKRFIIKKQKILSLGLRGKTVALVCEKPVPEDGNA